MTPGNRLLVVFFLFLAGFTWPVAAAGGQLSLTWVNTSTDELEFSVERSVGSTGTFAVLATTGPGVTAYVDTTVAEATTYCYQVRAFNASAFSEYSNPACATAAPAALAVTLSINQQVFALGDRFEVEASITNEGPPAVVDVYWGTITRAGLGGWVVACILGQPWTGIPLSQGVWRTGELTDFFGCDVSPTPPGDSTVFVAVTQAGTTNVMALGTATVGYLP